MTATFFLDELPPLATRPRKRQPSGGRPIPSELLQFAADLRANPGRWATYPRPLRTLESARSTRQLINRAKSGAFREGGFRAVVRNNALYVMYAGNASDQS